MGKVVVVVEKFAQNIQEDFGDAREDFEAT